MISAVLALQGCAHSAIEKRIDEKVAEETTVKSQADLAQEAEKLIQASPDLSPDQKAKLMALRNSIRTQNELLLDQSLKLRSILIKDLLASDYDRKEVDWIKKKIRSIENKRISILFDGVEQANAILGRQITKNQHVVHDFADLRGGRGI